MSDFIKIPYPQICYPQILPPSPTNPPIPPNTPKTQQVCPPPANFYTTKMSPPTTTPSYYLQSIETLNNLLSCQILCPICQEGSFSMSNIHRSLWLLCLFFSVKMKSVVIPSPLPPLLRSLTRKSSNQTSNLFGCFGAFEEIRRKERQCISQK